MVLPGTRSELATTPATPPVQVTWVVTLGAQLAAGSPSETVTVTEAAPAVRQVKVGFWAVGLLIVPPVACHWYESGLGPESAS